MKIFTKKSIVLKIVIALVIVILFNFSAPTISNAAGMLEAIGGTLLSPMMDLLVAIGDGLIKVIQELIIGVDATLLKLCVDTSLPAFLGKLSAVLIFGIGVLAGVALLPATLPVAIVAGGVTAIATVGGSAIVRHYADVELADATWLPIYVISPEEVFKNKIALLDVNFFNPNEYEDIKTSSGETIDQSEQNSAAILQSTIARWYLALRNFAIVVLLSVLLYIAIRIIISSTAQDKAKYKEKLFSWIVAACLLFFMHYIMVFATTIVEAISEGILNEDKPVLSTIPLEATGKDYKIEVWSEELDEQGNPVEGSGEMTAIEAKDFFEENNMVTTDSNGTKFYLWPTNLMGQIRIDMQLVDKKADDDNKLLNKVGYTILYLVMVFYTIAFLVVYLKRLIMLAFLTMIAPLVAMTYPIDKMNDGNAQAFNMWLKEYVFNLLLQPLHLILYTMLVSSAIEFATEHIIYAIVALGFIFQAEKILRKFFGFEKASTLESGSAIGGAVAMLGINQLGKISKLGSGKKGEDKDKAKNSKIYQRKADKGHKISDLINNNYGSNEESEGGNILGAGVSTAQALGSGNAQGSRTSRTSDGTDAYRRNLESWRDEMRTQGHSEDYINRVAPLPNARNAGSATSGTSTPRITSLGSTPTTGGSAISTTNVGYRPRTREINGFKTKVGGALKGAGAVAKYVAPKAGRLALKGGLAAAAATIGVAGGLASSDDKNILKYGAAGAATGWVAGSALGNSVPNMVSGAFEGAENIASTYTIASGGEDAEKERQKRISDDLARRDRERKKTYKEEFNLRNKKEIDRMMDLSQRYRESGITDDDIIIKAMKAEGFGEDKASKERIILAGLAQETGDDVEKIKQLEGRLQEKGISATDARKYTDGIRAIHSKT